MNKIQLCIILSIPVLLAIVTIAIVQGGQAEQIKLIQSTHGLQ